jgi:hypothetical protein
MLSTLNARRSPRSRQSRGWLSACRPTLAGTALVLGTLGIVLSATAVRADHLNLALGGNGQLYSVQAGLYGALFGSAGVQAAVAGAPAPSQPPANTSVLALDTTAPGAPTQRQLVPTTDDGAVDSSPALIYEDASSTLFLVWVSSSDPTSSVVKLLSYNGSQWSQPIQIISNPYATKTAPQLTLTRDSYPLTDATTGAVTVHRRTVLHVVWSEDSLSGLYQAYYAPVIFEDGVWIGTVPEPMLLNSYDLAESTTPGGPFATPLVYSPTVQSGRDVSTAITAFASDASGMLTAVELDFLPEQLRMLADSCAAAMTANGAQYFPGNLTALAAQAQAALQANGSAFQPEALQAIGSDMQTQILSGGTSNLTTMALKTRAVIIDSGARLAARGLKIGPLAPPGTIAPSQIVEIVPPNGGPSQFLQFRVASTRPWPTVGGTNGMQLFVSHTGDNALASWLSADGTSAYYTNTQLDGSWSPSHQIQLSTSLTLDQALQVLQQRVY